VVFGGRLADVNEVCQVDPRIGEYTVHRGDRQAVDEVAAVHDPVPPGTAAANHLDPPCTVRCLHR
jgi:hypothetical protein